MIPNHDIARNATTTSEAPAHDSIEPVTWPAKPSRIALARLIARRYPGDGYLNSEFHEDYIRAWGQLFGMCALSWKLVPMYGVALTAEATKCGCWLGSSCRAKGKHPQHKGWQDVASDRPTDVIGWSMPYPYKNGWQAPNWAIAVGASGMVAIDIDVQHEGAATWRALLEKHGDIPLTPGMRTKSGGWRFFFCEPPQERAPSKAQIYLGVGVEYHAHNHLAIIPPSVGDNGRPYSWLAAPWDVHVAELPEWILVLALDIQSRTQTQTVRRHAPIGSSALATYDADRAKVVERARAYVAKMPIAIEGQRGSAACMAVANKLVQGFGLTREEARPLIAEYSDRCEPPWSDQELSHKLDDAEKGDPAGRPTGYLLEIKGDDEHRDNTFRLRRSVDETLARITKADMQRMGLWPDPEGRLDVHAATTVAEVRDSTTPPGNACSKDRESVTPAQIEGKSVHGDSNAQPAQAAEA